jgi:hypothetical protein
MGFAWVSDDAGRAVLPARGAQWQAGPRHRRPTLLARGGQAVADRITSLARQDLTAPRRPDTTQIGPRPTLTDRQPPA